MRHLIAVVLSAAALYATPQLHLSTSTIGPLNIAVGQNGSTATVTASNIGSGSLSLSASSNVTWLNPSISGNSVVIGLTTNALAQGIYTGLVTVSSPGAIDAPQTISVTVQMGGGVPNSLTLYVAPGGTTKTSFVASNIITDSVTPPSGGITLSIAATGGGSFQTTGSYVVTTTAPAATTPETTYTGSINISASNFAPDVKRVPVTVNVTAEPIVELLQTSLQFNVGANATAPVVKWIELVNVGEGTLSVSSATVSTTASTGSAWLTTSINGTTVVATSNPTGLSPGKYTATVTIAGNAKNGPFTIPVEMDIVPTAPPYSYYQGVVDNALYQVGATVAPGGLVIVRGEQFTTGAAVPAPSLPLGTTLGNATVYVNGNAVPIDYVAASHVVNMGGQITFQMPYGTPAGQATVRVDRNDNGTVQTGNTISVPVAPIEPRLLPYTLNGTAYAIATFTDYTTFPFPTTPGIPTRAANPGDTLIFYGLGFGQTSPAVTEGIAVSGLANVGNCLMVFGGASIIEATDTTAVPSYCGLTPASVGLYQVNVTVPTGTPKGSAVPVFLTIGASATSNTVAIAVQ
jgi:uncharacterized protein (TIGR03437 family)